MRYCLPYLFGLLSFYAFSQTAELQKPSRKLTFYGTWGYSRWAFTKSTIHFKNTGASGDPNPSNGTYDFKIYNSMAHDSPDFDQIASKWSDIVNITIPQFNVRIGFFMNNRQDEGWEINYDHAKYIVDDQKVRIKGNILGEEVDKDTLLQSPNFHFEHTDGANFWQINYIKRWKLYTGKEGRNNIGWILKPGAGIVVPRTDVTLFGTRLNNCWRLAGFIAGVETGIRGEFFDHLCVEFTGKAAYANYLWCYVQYKGNGNANHRFGTVGAILSVGYQFHHTFNQKKKVNN